MAFFGQKIAQCTRHCIVARNLFLAHSMNGLMQSRGVRRPSVCLSVCKLFCANRYFYHKHDWIATKLAHDGPHMDLHPGCAQGQGQGQRSRDTDTFLITRKSLLLPQTWPDRHQTCIWWSPHRPASRVVSRSRFRSKVTWYGHFCDVTKCLLYSTFWRSVSLHALTLRSTVTLSFQYKCQTARQLVMSTSWNELLRHWRSGCIIYRVVQKSKFFLVFVIASSGIEQFSKSFQIFTDTLSSKFSMKRLLRSHHISNASLKYRVRQIKVIPCRVLLISQQRIWIFIRKFTRLFLIHIYI